MHGRRSKGEDVDPIELQRAVEGATAAVIAAQVEAGVDIGNDGEQARESFVTYVQHRMTGFGGTSQRPMMRDLQEHPDFLELAVPASSGSRSASWLPRGIAGRVAYRDTSELDAECAS
jgi:5-methyltetrahydropteroyltriglutamate--homocysteine methyltransferase